MQQLQRQIRDEITGAAREPVLGNDELAAGPDTGVLRHPGFFRGAEDVEGILLGPRRFDP